MNLARISAGRIIACLLGIVLLSGCSTVAKRINEERPTFDKLSAADQGLVSRGRIREGLGKRAVYIAWGRPDRIVTGSVKKKAFETWIYFGYWTDTYFQYNWVPYSCGNRIYWQPVTVPYYTTNQYVYRSTTFENGRVVAFQTPAFR